MNNYADKTNDIKTQSASNRFGNSLVGDKPTLQLRDNRPSSVVQKKQIEAMTTGTPAQRKNDTGLPDQLKSGIENLSGHSMDDVKVHYNSARPAQLNAHAYAQGTDIHLAPGQEKHLPHEAWHVVQQKQGRVKPTMQMKNKVNINDEKGLEKEADIMGTAALLKQPVGANKTAEKKINGNTIAQRKGVIQRGGAAVTAGADENLQATGRGIEGIQGLINALTPADVNPACYVGVMVRYPTWGNYLKAKGGHAAIQIKVDFGDHRGIKYIQAGVSATGSIQIEPIFHSVKTRDGYNIKQLTKSVDKNTCISVLKAVAKEIAISQPYQERIIVNTGSKTNCSLWAAKMAAIAGINLGTAKMWVFPSPNDLQHALDYYRNTTGHTLTDSTTLQDEALNVNVNVGTVPAPQFDADFNVANNLSPGAVNALKDWAKKLS